MWHFTKHVQERMLERKYTREEVLMVLNGEVPSLTFPSPKESMVDMVFGSVGDKFMMIPIDRLSHSVITIRAMRKDEKAIFLKEVGNG